MFNIFEQFYMLYVALACKYSSGFDHFLVDSSLLPD